MVVHALGEVLCIRGKEWPGGQGEGRSQVDGERFLRFCTELTEALAD